MLVLSRKPDQTIMIGSDISITVMSVKNNRVKIGIQAPSDVRILRQELVLEGPCRQEGRQCTTSLPAPALLVPTPTSRVVPR